MRLIIAAAYLLMAAWLLLAAALRIHLLLRIGAPLDPLPFVSGGLGLLALLLFVLFKGWSTSRWGYTRPRLETNPPE